jgi:uncharacterized protein YbcV (DUF1398 family)
MSSTIDTLLAAQQQAMAVRPKIGGFPYLAAVLRQAGVRRNRWSLPSCQSVYVMQSGSVVQQGQPLVTGTVDVAPFDEAALVKAIRTDQAGESTFPEFLQAAWQAGVTWYEVDFDARTVTYGGADGESYLEAYPAVVV